MGNDRTVLLRQSPEGNQPLDGHYIQMLRAARDELLNMAGHYMRLRRTIDCYECLAQAGRITHGLVRRQRALRR